MLVGYMQSNYISDRIKSAADRFSGDKWVEWVKRIGEANVRMAQSIDSEDNPILLFFRIKDF
jgi:hypothetical protein